MRKLRAPTPGRLALSSLATLAAALLLPFAASAQLVMPAPPTVSSDVCDYASNKPAQLQARLDALFLSLGFLGLPDDDCPKFVKNLVKSCLQIVAAETTCSLDANAAVGKIEDYSCDAEATQEDQKSCKQSNKQDLQKAQAVAGQTVKILGDVACNGDFALRMEVICRDGVIPPPT